MTPKFAALLAGMVRAGMPVPIRSFKVCKLCGSPIVQGDGSRMLEGIGTVHGRCANAREETNKPQHE